MIPGDWVEQAACKDELPDDFFSDDQQAVARAMGFCLRCPVKEKCGQFAVVTDTWFGIFGGLKPVDRRNRHKPGPPKQPDQYRQVKDCPTCRRALDRDHFALSPGRSDGLSGECKACRLDRKRRIQAGKKAS